MGSLTGPAKPRFAAGRFVAVEADRALFGLPNRMHRDRCEEVKSDVEAALAAHFGRPVPLHLVVDHGDPPETSSPDDEVVELEGLTEADAALISPEDRLKQAFPGAEEVLQ